MQGPFSRKPLKKGRYKHSRSGLLGEQGNYRKPGPPQHTAAHTPPPQMKATAWNKWAMGIINSLAIQQQELDTMKPRPADFLPAELV